MINRMKNDLRDENRYMRNRRKEIEEALKETIRINKAIK